jgi:mono/diheme cytochrome c family protein
LVLPYIPGAVARILRTIAFEIVCLGLLPAAAHAQTLNGRPLSEASGQELYRATCAGCHGDDGRGFTTDVLGFDAEVPDFTECSFATPETEADWVAVVLKGGPVRAFDRRMPAFGDLLSADQAQKVVAYVRSLCSDRAWPRGELNLPRPHATEKAFPENEAVMATSITSGPGAVETEFIYEKRIGSRGQYELVVPINVIERPTGGWDRGLGDIKVAYKRVLFHSENTGSIFSLAGELKFPTGKETQGLGGGRTVIEGFAAFGQILPRDGFVHLQAGVERAITRLPANAEAFWRGAIGKTFAQDGGFGRTWSPMVELLGAREVESGAAVDWDILPQVQVSLSKRQHILMSAGYRIPLNNADVRQKAFVVYLLWDWFDGGFFSGWK